MGLFDWIKRVFQKRADNRLIPVLRSDLSLSEIKEGVKKGNTRVVEYLDYGMKGYRLTRKIDQGQITYAFHGIKGIRENFVSLTKQKQIVLALRDEIFSFIKSYDGLLNHMDLFLKKKETAQKLVDEINSNMNYLKNRIQYLESKDFVFKITPSQVKGGSEIKGGLIWEKNDAYEKKTAFAAIALYKTLHYKMAILITHILQDIGTEGNNLTIEKKGRLVLYEHRMSSYIEEFYRTTETVKGKSSELDKEIEVDTQFFIETFNAVKKSVNEKLSLKDLRNILREMQRFFVKALPKEQAEKFGKAQEPINTLTIINYNTEFERIATIYCEELEKMMIDYTTEQTHSKLVDEEGYSLGVRSFDEERTVLQKVLRSLNNQWNEFITLKKRFLDKVMSKDKSAIIAVDEKECQNVIKNINFRITNPNNLTAKKLYSFNEQSFSYFEKRAGSFLKSNNKKQIKQNGYANNLPDEFQQAAAK